MPMKYSTFRSKRCEPSRCSRIARFVSGVIQFSRPISSSGPHGLFETFSPSCSSSAFHVKVSSTLAIARSSSQVFDRALLLDQRAVQLGAAVAEEVQLVLTGERRSPCPAPSRASTSATSSASSVSPASASRVAVRVDDLAPAAELAPALLADPVRGQEVDRGSRRRARRVITSRLELRGAIGKFVGCATMSAPLQRERARDLREAEVVADIEPDPAERGVEDLELVARSDEAVDAEERQMRLAVGADQAVGADEHGGVVERVAVALEQPADRRGRRAARTRARAPRSSGPGSPPRTAAPPRRCRTCTRGSRTPGARAAGRRRPRLPRAARERRRDSAPSRRAWARSGPPRPASRGESNSLTFADDQRSASTTTSSARTRTWSRT